MNEPTPIQIASAMIRKGGSFVKALGEALLRADDRNTQRILEAFPDYIETYAAIARQHAAKEALKP